MPFACPGIIFGSRKNEKREKDTLSSPPLLRVGPRSLGVRGWILLREEEGSMTEGVKTLPQSFRQQPTSILQDGDHQSPREPRKVTRVKSH